MPDLRRRIIVSFHDDGGLERHTRQVRRSRTQVTGLSGAFSRLAGMVPGVGTIIATTFATVAAVLGKSAGAAIRLEQAMVEVRKTTGLSGGALRGLTDNMVRLQSELGIASTELAQIAAVAGQLGIEGTDNISSFVRTIAQMSRVSELTAEEAATNMARVANAFDLPITQAENLGSVLNELSNTTTATTRDLTTALAQIGNSGAQIGLTVDQVSALVATTIDAGVNVGRVGTQLRNIFTFFQTEADKLAEVAGVTREEFNTLVEEDALAALRLYLDGLRELPSALQTIRIKDVFGQENITAVQALVRQTEILNGTLETSGRAFIENTSLQTEFRASLESVSAGWNLLKQSIGAAATELGQRFLPFLDEMIDKALELTRLFDSPSENLLRVLRQMPDVDPSVIRELELQIRQADLVQRRQEAMAALQNNAQVRTNIRPSDLQFLGPLAATISFDTENIREKTEEELNTMIAGYSDALQQLRDLNLNELGRIEREKTTRIIGEIENQVEAIQNQIAARKELVAVNEALASTERDIAQERLGLPADPLGRLFEGLSPLGTDGSGDGGGPDLEALQKAQDLFRSIAEQQALINTLSSDHRQALQDVIDIQDRLNGLKEIEARLGEDATVVVAGQEVVVRDLIDSLEEQLEKAREKLRIEKEFAETTTLVADNLSRLTPLPPEAFGPTTTQVETLSRLSGAVEDYRNRVTQLKNDLQAGNITESQFFAALEKEGEKLRKILIALRESLRALGLLTPELERAFNEAFAAIEGGADKAAESTKTLADEFQNLGSSLRAVTRFADVFGDLDDDIRSVLDGTADLLDNFGRLLETRTQLGNEGTALGSFSGIVGQAAPVIGLAAGAASIITGLVGAIKKRGEDEQRATEQQIRAMQDLARSIEDSARSIRASFEDQFDEPIVGEGLTPTEIRASQNQAQLLRRSIGQPGLLDEEGMRTIIQAFVDRGIIDADALTLWEDLLEQFGGNEEAAMFEFLKQTGLEAALEDFAEKAHQYSETIAGAGQEFEDNVRFFGMSAIEALEAWAERIINLEDVSPEAQERLDRVREITSDGVITPEEREELKAIAAFFAQEGVALGDQFSETEDRSVADMILDAMGPAPEEIAEASDKFAEAIREGGQNIRDAFAFAETLGLTPNQIADIVFENLEKIFNLQAEDAGLPSNVKRKTLLRTAANLDLTTEAGRERLQEIIKQVTTAIAAGTTLEQFGMTDEQARQMLDYLESIDHASQVGQESQFTASVTNLRQLSVAQGAEVVFLLIALETVARMQLDQLRVIAARLGADPSSVVSASVSQPSVNSAVQGASAAPQLVRGTATTINNAFNINVSDLDRDGTIRQIVTEVERFLQDHLPG